MSDKFQVTFTVNGVKHVSDEYDEAQAIIMAFQVEKAFKVDTKVEKVKK